MGDGGGRHGWGGVREMGGEGCRNMGGEGRRKIGGRGRGVGCRHVCVWGGWGGGRLVVDGV